MTATDHDSLLAAVLHDPFDDTPRLILCDWLEEHGEPERAEFIRVQCELSQLERKRAEILNDNTDWNLCDTESGVSASWCPNCGDCSCPDREERMDDPGCPLHATDSSHLCLTRLGWRQDELRRRERELWSANWPNWVSRDWWGNDAIGTAVKTGCGVGNGKLLVEFSRGFPSAASLTLREFLGGEVCGQCGEPDDEWFGFVRPTRKDGSQAEVGWVPCLRCHGTGRTPGLAPKLFGGHPLGSVRLTCREPLRWAPDTGSSSLDYPDRFSWINEDKQQLMGDEARRRAYIPGALFDLIEKMPGADIHFREYARFDSLDLAHLALSRAAVAYGRSVADGREYKAVCERCKGKKFWMSDEDRAKKAAGSTVQARTCRQCSGSGTLTRPGLPPLVWQEPTASGT